MTANVEVGVRHGRYETLFSPEDVPELRCSGAALREPDDSDLALSASDGATVAPISPDLLLQRINHPEHKRQSRDQRNE